MRCSNFTTVVWNLQEGICRIAKKVKLNRKDCKFARKSSKETIWCDVQVDFTADCLFTTKMEEQRDRGRERNGAPALPRAARPMTAALAQTIGVHEPGLTDGNPTEKGMDPFL